MKYSIVDSFEIDQITELTFQVIRLPGGEEAFVFEDCTGGAPVIYKWAFEMANLWLKDRKQKEELI